MKLTKKLLKQGHGILFSEDWISNGHWGLHKSAFGFAGFSHDIISGFMPKGKTFRELTDAQVATVLESTGSGTEYLRTRMLAESNGGFLCRVYRSGSGSIATFQEEYLQTIGDPASMILTEKEGNVRSGRFRTPDSHDIKAVLMAVRIGEAKTINGLAKELLTIEEE